MIVLDYKSWRTTPGWEPVKKRSSAVELKTNQSLRIEMKRDEWLLSVVTETSKVEFRTRDSQRGAFASLRASGFAPTTFSPPSGAAVDRFLMEKCGQCESFRGTSQNQKGTTFGWDVSIEKRRRVLTGVGRTEQQV